MITVPLLVYFLNPMFPTAKMEKIQHNVLFFFVLCLFLNATMVLKRLQMIITTLCEHVCRFLAIVEP